MTRPTFRHQRMSTQLQQIKKVRGLGQFTDGKRTKANEGNHKRKWAGVKGRVLHFNNAANDVGIH